MATPCPALLTLQSFIALNCVMTSDQALDQPAEPIVTPVVKTAVTTFKSFVGINEAARLAGKGKQQIYRDIQAGKLSYQDQNGKKLIQVADLDRLYTLKSQSVTSNDNSSENRVLPPDAVSVTNETAIENARLQVQIEAERKINGLLTSQIEDLMHQRNILNEQNNRLTLMLTSSAPKPDTTSTAEPEVTTIKPAAVTPETLASTPPPVQKRSLWDRITGR